MAHGKWVDLTLQIITSVVKGSKPRDYFVSCEWILLFQTILIEGWKINFAVDKSNLLLCLISLLCKKIVFLCQFVLEDLGYWFIIICWIITRTLENLVLYSTREVIDIEYMSMNCGFGIRLVQRQMKIQCNPHLQARPILFYTALCLRWRNKCMQML